MKKSISILILISFFITSFTPYDSDLVTFSTQSQNGVSFKIIKMDRFENHIKAKYFAVRDKGKSVPERFKSWSVGRDIISVCSGTYMNDCNPNASPVSLTIDQGNVVNNTLANMDGAVVVYASGQIVVGNVKSGELKIDGRNYNLNNSLEKSGFLRWAETNKATVFQTHLLIYKNNLTVYSNGSSVQRERRFLAGSIDAGGNSYNYIVHIPSSVSLLDGATAVKGFLMGKEKMKSIDYLINLDTGCQDYFQAYNSSGQARADYRGNSDISQSINLISFYYE